MKQISLEAALHKAAAYCSRSEHSTQEIRQKLSDWGLPFADHQQIVDRLVSEKFIDDRRFCKSYINDKYRYSKWGRIKIIHHLRAKGIDQRLFQEVSEGVIDLDIYEENLRHILKEKLKATKAASTFELKGKLVRFAAARGYELDIIYALLDEILKDDA